tara:strand:- start:899 stop:1267 length:369 start_codon:yes stop_codon:yes gene_type:complete
MVFRLSKIMIENQLDNLENKKGKLQELTFRELRQEAQKISVPLYSRKTKSVLVDFILKYQKKVLIKDQTNENIISNSHSELNRILSKLIPFLKLKTILKKSFPDKKITVTDNKDGSQTILIS